jgi:hypothetical protein
MSEQNLLVSAGSGPAGSAPAPNSICSYGHRGGHADQT